MTRSFFAFTFFLCIAVPAAAAEFPVTLKNHKFSPSEIHVKANEPNVIILSNKDATADEFDSSSLKVEKVVAGHETGNVRLRPLSPGAIRSWANINPDTAQGVVIAE